MNKSLLAVCLALCVSMALGAALNDVVPANVPAPFCAAECLTVGVYIMPHFRSCSMFYRCVHGFIFEETCPQGQAFDHVTLACQTVSRCVFQGPVPSED